jgi:hypothetical protein
MSSAISLPAGKIEIPAVLGDIVASAGTLTDSRGN